ncbi:DUF5344 family protein, partial [Bacillus licheniformis]|uniref:DUF5344 family protein n=2 Tax=Bacillaceae TaxID=186817 RepID=UPI003B58AF45
LQTKISALSISGSKADIANSSMDVVNKIKKIEKEYEQLLKKYKEALSSVEKDAWSNIKVLIDTDKNISQKMK